MRGKISLYGCAGRFTPQEDLLCRKSYSAGRFTLLPDERGYENSLIFESRTAAAYAYGRTDKG